MMCHRIGRPPISTIGFGLRSVSSPMRVPRPPARMTAFIKGPWGRGRSRPWRVIGRGDLAVYRQANAGCCAAMVSPWPRAVARSRWLPPVAARPRCVRYRPHQPSTQPDSRGEPHIDERPAGIAGPLEEPSSSGHQREPGPLDVASEHEAHAALVLVHMPAEARQPLQIGSSPCLAHTATATLRRPPAHGTRHRRRRTHRQA